MNQNGADIKNQAMNRLNNYYKSVIKDEEIIFRLKTTLKMTLIPIISGCVMAGFLWVLLQLNLYFFEANGYEGWQTFRESYYEFIVGRSLRLAPYISLFIAIVAITGIYVSDLLLRPFRIIGDYCEKVVNGEEASYDPDFFTDLKLLTTFSELFFLNIHNTRKAGRKLDSMDIPKKYTRIHQPVSETAFFLQYFLYILIVSICAYMALYIVAVDIHHEIINLANETLRSSKMMSYFFTKQTEVLQQVLTVVMVGHLLLYVALARHLYYKVCGPAFGIFATMRSFLKGNYSSRVHLIGYYYLRTHCRKLNRYLDQMQKELT